MYQRIAAIHVAAYMIFAPFLGGFAISLCKYIAETKLDLAGAFISSIGCGIGAIILYGVPGLFVAILSLPLATIYKLNPVGNLLAGVGLTWWAYTRNVEFTGGYEAIGIISGLLFTGYVCSMELRVFDAHQRQLGKEGQGTITQ
jgi:hypothetical protein